MSVLTDTWRQLVQRRLLPVALLLVAALAAVPLVLAKKSEPAATPVTAAPKPAATSASASAATAAPIVSLVEDGERTKRRRVLGARKNPFQPAPVKLARPSTSTSRSTSGTPAGTGGTPVDGNSGSGSPSVGSPLVPTTPGVTTPTAPKRSYELYSLTVRFGDASSESLSRMNLSRLKALPSVEEPILVYLGVSGDKKTAIFMVDTGVVAQGDGTCRPHPSNCETIHLQEGETEFFDVTDENGNVTSQFQLDLVDIKQRKTADAAQARKARAKASPAGRVILEARTSAMGPLRYRYDARTGTVRRLGEKAFQAVVAKFAKAAAAAE
jgi:hypothetical protein